MFAACHLFNGEGYNASYVRSLMPGVPAVLINLSYRLQGFYVQKGNPKGITGWQDLARDDLTILNRRPGSSSRILLRCAAEKTRHFFCIPKRVRSYCKIASHGCGGGGGGRSGSGAGNRAYFNADRRDRLHPAFKREL